MPRCWWCWAHSLSVAAMIDYWCGMCCAKHRIRRAVRWGGDDDMMMTWRTDEVMQRCWRRRAYCLDEV